MSTTKIKPRVIVAWQDRFSKPTLEDLSSHLDAPSKALFNSARELFEGYDEAMEWEILWQGLPWRWTLTYSLPGDPTRAFGYLVPSEEGITVSVPMTSDMIKALPMRRIKKFVRERLVTNRIVGNVYWNDWQITAKSQLADVMDIAKRKYRFLSEAKKS